MIYLSDHHTIASLCPKQPLLKQLYLYILYYTILYYTILYYTILYYTILYYTIKAQLLALFPLQISKTNETSYEPTL